MIAIPLHQSRVAPVLDWCSTILLIPIPTAESWCDAERLSVKTNVFDLLRLLRSMGVSPVICGAVSPNALHYGRNLGLEFICGISGAIDEVIEAYRAGELDQPRFRLPGCRCPMRRQHLAGLAPDHLLPEQPGTLVVRNQGKGGSGRRQGGENRGRSSAGRRSAVAGAMRVCPQCGKEVPHRRGMPCIQEVCQACGTPLVRKLPAPEPSL